MGMDRSGDKWSLGWTEVEMSRHGDGQSWGWTDVEMSRCGDGRRWGRVVTAHDKSIK